MFVSLKGQASLTVRKHDTKTKKRDAEGVIPYVRHSERDEESKCDNLWTNPTVVRKNYNRTYAYGRHAVVRKSIKMNQKFGNFADCFVYG